VNKLQPVGKTRWIALGLVTCCVLGQGEPRAASGEEQQVAEAIEKALRKHGADVHRCFQKALADRLAVAGMVELSVGVGKAGKVKAAKVKKIDKSAPPALASCIEQAALGWTLDGIEAGAELVLPFSFKPQQSQYVVSAADVPERVLGAAASSKSKPGPRHDVPFSVKVLADETNVKATDISLTLLNVGPASRVAMHRHPGSAKLLYLVKGHARLLGPSGVLPVKLDEGMAAFIPSGYPHVIENMGRQSTAVFLQAFAPPGPERVYRDPKDARGRADFEVIRDAAQAKVPPEAEGKLVVASAVDGKTEVLPHGGGTARKLVEGALSATLYEWSDGAEVRSQGGLAATQVFYFIAGGGSLEVAGETQTFAVESVLYLPRGTAYSMKVAAADKGEKVVAVMFHTAGRARSRAGHR